MAKKAASTEVATTGAAALPANVNPALAALGTGMENVRPDEFILPFYTILQGLSPQIETVEGAKPGIIINTTTNKMYPEGLNLVGVRTLRQFVRWKPNRGGWVAAYPDESHPEVAKALQKVKGDPFAKLITDDGDEIQETYYLTGVVVTDEGKLRGFGQIAFKVTGIKKYKAWISMCGEALTEHQMPMFGVIYKWTTQKERNRQNKEYYNWATAPMTGNVLTSAVSDPQVIEQIVKIKKADIKIDYSQERAADADSEAM